MPNHHDSLDLMFTALADANRRAIIDSLSHSNQSVTELATPLGISLPATMQHLSLLEQSGLVTTKKVGRIRTCTLDTAALSRAEKWINQRRQLWSDRLDTLGDYLSAAMDAEREKRKDEK